MTIFDRRNSHDKMTRQPSALRMGSFSSSVLNSILSVLQSQFIFSFRNCLSLMDFSTHNAHPPLFVISERLGRIDCDIRGSVQPDNKHLLVILSKIRSNTKIRHDSEAEIPCCYGYHYPVAPRSDFRLRYSTRVSDPS
jgi:hypothetical protein